ncbi:MAG: hypothetical protein ACRCYX_10095 [Dermatophilaceae bacterium]
MAGLYWPGFIAAPVADRLAAAFLAHQDRTNYQARWSQRSGSSEEFTDTDTDRVGPIDTTASASALEIEVVEALRWQREVVAPSLGPIDKLRLELDEALPGGAGLTRRRGVLQFAGVGRIMERSDVSVHADAGRTECLTANVYLRMPGTGGGTTIWRYDADYRRAGRSYLFAPGEIPAGTPEVTFRAEPGALVIWDPTRPHAILPFSQGVRVTVQTWVQVRPDSDGRLRASVLN